MTQATFWDKAAPKYAKSPIGDPKAYEETLGRMRHHLQPDHEVLEIGCGTGSTALQLAPGVRRYHGTDISPAMIGIAKGKLDPAKDANLSFSASPAGDLPEGPFDAILALNLLHLVPDLEDVVARVHAKLPEGGLFIAKTALLRDGSWFLSPAIAVMKALGKAPYVRKLSAAELRAILRDAGFETVEEILQPGLAPRLFTVMRKV